MYTRTCERTSNAWNELPFNLGSKSDDPSARPVASGSITPHETIHVQRTAKNCTSCTPARDVQGRSPPYERPAPTDSAFLTACSSGDLTKQQRAAARLYKHTGAEMHIFAAVATITLQVCCLRQAPMKVRSKQQHAVRAAALKCMLAVHVNKKLSQMQR